MNDFQRTPRFGGKRSGGFARPQGQVFQATCAQCGKACDVPFRPNGQRPVYCRDCFRGVNATSDVRRPQPQMPYQSAPRWRAPQPMPATIPTPRVVEQKPDHRIDEIMHSISKIQSKLDKILLELAVKDAQSKVPAIDAVIKKIAKRK
ncbi:MAG: hypothetical protein KBC02_01620 [Candidatus Pacebacteria bacterium]|nr:hypothetical protein [Candidatus Paceibacterota bacterium]